jgi:hypothetical protein
MPENKAKPAGGPRTPAGKAKSRRNARIHGIFCSELTMSDAERSEFNDLRTGLTADLKPNGAVRELLFDNVVAAAWQLKIATRALEAAVHPVIQEPTAEPNVGAESTAELAQTSSTWFRARLKLLDELQHQAVPLRIRPGMEAAVTQAFGLEFWKTLSQWEPVNDQAIKIACVLTAHYENHRSEPEHEHEPPTPEERDRYLYADSFSRGQMIQKLIEREREHVLQLHQAHAKAKGSPAENTHRLELFLRYRTAARRDFYRALAEFEAR